MVELQRQAEEYRNKLTLLEQEAQKSSNAYTSASIRANQHAETLQAQYMLLSQQRDELSSKLSAAEDKESKNQAALINLQCALEQFQRDKDRDIEATTYRIRKQLEDERKAHMDVLTE
uniref:Uncharacterized protein n=2 Tax=Lutzomyia longipalpis TaxID=7200 RepID=A0A1B0CY01_LUTLO